MWAGRLWAFMWPEKTGHLFLVRISMCALTEPYINALSPYKISAGAVVGTTLFSHNTILISCLRLAA